MSDEPPPLQPAPKKRCTVYIDAFNWYYGIFVHHPEWKCLNIQSFFEYLRLDEEVTWIGFFSAIVEPQRHQSTKRDRQKRYLQALKAQPKIEIVLGKYQERIPTTDRGVRTWFLRGQSFEHEKVFSALGIPGGGISE